MQVRHVKTLQPAQGGIARTQAICWSPNNKRLAVADFGRFVHLYDEAGERRDKFSTKPADAKGAKTFVVKDMAFSPDSSKLAIAQSDFIVFVYKLGLEWGEKKSICNKFPQSSAATCMVWPQGTTGNELIVFGTQEGKVRVAFLKTNKSQTLFSHDAAVVSVAASPDGNHIISGHADGSIFRYTFEGEDGSAGGQGASRIAQHSCVPYSLDWGETIAAAGTDCVVTFYDRTGHVLQNFDYPQAQEKEITKAKFNPSGQTLAVASFNKVRLFNFNIRSRKWEEGNVALMNNAYAITAMSWKVDGSRLVTGTLCGAVDVFDCCLKRYRLRGAFEFTYVSHNQVIVKRLSTGTRIVLKSHLGYEIQKVNVHKDRFLVAHTATTLLIGDLGTCKLSEVPWHLSGREKYVFDNPQVCMVFAAGELCLIEYGKNEVLGTCRTEETNMHRLSVRIHEPSAENPSKVPPRKAIAYLIDRQTIQVDDLITGIPAARVSHTHKIDWLELNHRANKLLFRDKQRRLYLLDINTQEKVTLLNFCTYVQWVPDSDVVVAQNRVDLCVWYSIDSPDRVAIVPIKGEVEGIERTPGKTEVIVDEGVNTVAYGLDESLIEFGTAMDDQDYDRACDLLDQITLTPETEAMWNNLSKIAVSEMKLYIAERCFAALGDVAKAHALNHINQLAAEAAKESGGATDGYDHFSVRAELYILNKEFKRAEQVYLENGKPEKAMEMWDEMYRFDESIQVAESRGHPDAANRRAKYFSWLLESGQEEKAGEVKEREGKYLDAINLYLRGGVPARAAHVVSTYNVRPEQQLLEAIASALFKAKIFEKAGDLFEKLKMDERAIDAYKQGHVYGRAVDLANRVFPTYVVALEDAWGDHLVAQKQVDQAINHYIQAHQYGKAIQSAIASRQWGKAVEILERHNVGDPNDANVKGFYRQIARHYEEQHQTSDAEKFYIRAGAVNEAVDMYLRRGMSDAMYRVAQRHLSEEEIGKLFMEQAKQCEVKGDYASAERIYLKINRPDDAIVMYKKARDFVNMIRLVQTYRPDFLIKTYLSLAAMFLKEDNFKQAENYYVLGKEWAKAVAMYRDKNMWEDAVRVAKVGGGAPAAKQVVLSRAMSIDPEEGVRLLIKFSMVDSGIEAALEAQKYDVAIQWAQLAMPAKLPYVFLKNAMHWEDQGEFRMAEDAFIKASKPREAIDMYIHQHDFNSARRVAEGHDQSAIPSICTAHARVAFQQGAYKEAEALLLQANAPDLLIKFYRDARMYQDAQRIARDYVPEKLGEISRDAAMSMADPLQAASMLEDNGEHALAIESYLKASRDHTNDPNILVSAWCRAVRLAQSHARHLLKDTLKIATAKLLEIGRAEEAGKCLEDCEDYKGAINVYVKGKKYDLAEKLADRISPELVEYVKRARVQEALESNTATGRDELDTLDKDAALKAHIASNDWDKAMRLARQLGPEETKRYAAMQCKYLLSENQVARILDVIARDGMCTDDFRFFNLWVEAAHALVMQLPNAGLNLAQFHDGLVEVVEQMVKQAQPDELVNAGRALRDILHIYSAAGAYKAAGFADVSVKLMLGLPRYVHVLPADKAYCDAGLAARDAGMDSVAFIFFNRFLDIIEKIDEGEPDSSNMDNTDFACTDFPFNFPLPRAQTVPVAVSQEINDWVLAVSVQPDKKLEPNLPQVPCPTSGVMMWEGALRSPSGANYEPCAVTGFPILDRGQRVSCRNCSRPANQDDWNRTVMVTKKCLWCGSTQSAVFNM